MSVVASVADLFYGYQGEFSFMLPVVNASFSTCVIIVWVVVLG